MTPSDYEMIEQGYDPPRVNEGELVYTGPGELATLRTQNAELVAALRLSRPFVNIATSAGQAEASTRWYDKAVAALTAIDAALAAEPANGEAEDE